MKNLNESNIKLVCFSELQEEPLDELQEQLKAITPNVSAEFRSPGPQAAWEWIAPTVIALYISKSVFDGFLQELGAEGARALKSSLSKAFSRTKERKLRWVTLEDQKKQLLEIEQAEVEKREPDKNRLEELGKPISVMSIEVSFGDGVYVRHVFPYQLSESQYASALSALSSIASEVADVAEKRKVFKNKFETLMKTEPSEAMKLSAASPNELSPGIVYVYLPERNEWVDVMAEHERERKASRINNTPK